MAENTPAQVFPPGEFVKEELDARDWAQADLAQIMGRPPQVVSEIVSGKRIVTPETAQGIADAFGTTAELWLNLEASWQAHLLAGRDQDDAVERRARLFEKAPIREMDRRGWIESSKDPDILERRLLRFLGIGDLDEEPHFLGMAARKSTTYEVLSPSQAVWLCRARQLASAVLVEPYSAAKGRAVPAALKSLIGSAEEIRHVPRVLAKAGIRLLVIEHLPKTRVDGACFWLDARSPIIALSVRFDRIDHFWHTLMHEIGHVLHRDGRGPEPLVESDLVGEASVGDRPEIELLADQFAVGSLVPQDELDGFIARVGPLYSKKAITGFAGRIGVHPGIVVGQLQFRGKIDWSHSRAQLVKVRDIITSSALTDGWGHGAPAVPGSKEAV